MIVFDLKCAKKHVFEAWFRSGADFEAQLGVGDIPCPYCGSMDIAKAVMSPNVGRKGNQRTSKPSPARDISVPVNNGPLPAELRQEFKQVVAKIRKHVESNCDYVGRDFPEEARKIHYGEAEARGIYGEASAKETDELVDEGIDILPLPATRRDDA